MFDKLKSKSLQATRIKSVTCVVVALEIMFALGLYFVEKDVQKDLSLADSFWWALVTMTTVGYGDVSPQTPIGRFFIAYPTMLIGIGFIGYLLSEVSATFVESFRNRRKGENVLKLKDHILFCNDSSIERVINLTKEIRDMLQTQVQVVLVTNTIEELTDSMVENNISFVKGDPACEDTLKRASIESCRGVVVLAPKDQALQCDSNNWVIAALAESLLKSFNSSARVVVESTSNAFAENASRLLSGGVVTQEGLSGKIMLQELVKPGISHIFKELLSAYGNEIYLVDSSSIYECNETVEIKSIQIAALRSSREVQILGIVRGDKPMINPKKEWLKPGDKLIVLTDDIKDLDQLDSNINLYL